MANILVCDDDKDIVEAIEIYLTQEGYHILKAYDGQEALDILHTEKVDLLIIDVMMPRLDGIRATVKNLRCVDTHSLVQPHLPHQNISIQLADLL